MPCVGSRVGVVGGGGGGRLTVTCSAIFYTTGL